MCGTLTQPPLPSLQLLEELKAVRFSLNNRSFHFDQDRSINTGFEVIGWRWKNRQIQFVSLGSFNRNLSINKALVQFHTEDWKV